MITVGIDMASRGENTAACRLRWGPGSVVVAELGWGLEDQDLEEWLRPPCAKTGIDVPLGWPEAFVDAVSRHRLGLPVQYSDVRQLTHRATDRRLGAGGLGWPLSVSADRIAYPALRAARLLPGIDRTGEGPVVEVYPALALRIWGLPHRRYKGKAGGAALARLVARLERELPGLQLAPSHRARLAADDNCADALVSALVARAAAAGLCEPIPEEELAAARAEGWIAVPRRCSLRRLTEDLPAEGPAAT